VTEEVRDHVSRCSRCQERLDLLRQARPDTFGRLGSLTRAATAALLDSTLARSAHRLQRWQAELERERTKAQDLLRQLLAQPTGRQRMLVRNHPRFRTWGLFERLLDKSREETLLDPAKGEEMARTALELSSNLDAERYGQEQIEDLRCRAWAYIGNARRVRADLRGAERAFRRAFVHLRRGTREPMERALFLDLKASLLRARRDFGDALRLLRRAHALFLAVGEKHRAGRTLVKISTVHASAGKPGRAIEVLHQAIALIDPAIDPLLLLSAWHNLIDNLVETGQFMEARKQMNRARDLYGRFSEPWLQARRRWLAAKIAWGLGQREEAEALLCAVREGVLAESSPYDHALVSLELATLYAEQGRTAELRRIAEELVPIFASRQIHREALAALTLWKQAVEAENAGAEMAADVAAFLRRARNDRGLRFQEAL
jgi:tetratricopeptide (TPR) repeat protein